MPGWQEPPCGGNWQGEQFIKNECPEYVLQGLNPIDTFPSLDSSIRDMLHRENVILKRERDSVWNLALTNNWEYFSFIIPIGNQTAFAGIKTDSTENYVVRNKRILRGKTPHGDYHTHQDVVPKDRHLHDPQDLIAGNVQYKNQLYFRSYVDCGDKLYVIVTENVDLFNSFLSTHNLPNEHASWLTPLYQSTNRRELGKQMLLALVGSSKTSGLSIYESLDADRVYFQKIN